MVNNDCMILGDRCRERNRQYENNNNCELDNGVYNKFVIDPDEGRHDPKKDEEEDESAILSDEEEEGKNIQREFEKRKKKQGESELEDIEK